ncbi:MAG: mechanosensitive ion channel family protein [Flammeovirgaceae bacterium]
MLEKLTELFNLSLPYLINFTKALAILIIGLYVIGVVVKFIRKLLHRNKIDETLRPFLLSLIKWGLTAMLVISVAAQVGIETTSFVAVLGAAGLAVGFALQGTLANFASGVLLLIFRPYKVGDLVEAAGSLGFVKEIQVFNTILATHDNKKVIIPNGSVGAGSIVNYTALGNIRVDLVIGIAYGEDIRKAREVMVKVMEAHDKVSKEPAPFVGVLELGDSSINLAVRPHCHPDDYWDVYFDIYEQCKIALDEAGIEIPFPQMDVHLDKLEG